MTVFLEQYPIRPWSKVDLLTEAAMKGCFPAGSVHVYTCGSGAYSIETFFLVLEDPKLHVWETMGKMGQHLGQAVTVVVKYLDLATGKRLSFQSNSNMHMASKRLS